MKRKIYILILIFVGAMTAYGDTMYVNLSHGEPVEALFDEIDYMVFGEDGSLTLVLKGHERVTYSGEEFVSLTFNYEDEPSPDPEPNPEPDPDPEDGIQVNEMSGTGFIYEGGMIVSPSDGISLYDLQGRLVVEQRGRRLSLSGVETGIYFVVSGGRTSKITVR